MDEELTRLPQLVEKITGLIHDHDYSLDEILSALANIYIMIWADACCAN